MLHFDFLLLSPRFLEGGDLGFLRKPKNLGPPCCCAASQQEDVDQRVVDRAACPLIRENSIKL